MSKKTFRLVILDRDGVINEDRPDYVLKVSQWQPIPGSLEAIGALKQAGFTIAIASNQAAIGKGWLTTKTLDAIHQHLQEQAATFQGHIDFIAYCPHTTEMHCECRKPKPGLLNTIAQHFDCSLEGVAFIGDNMRDIEAAQAVNAIPILVKTGHGQNTVQQLGSQPHSIKIFENLWHATQFLIHPNT